MATHSSIRAQKIPWIEEPGGLQSGVCKELGMTEPLSTQIHPFFTGDGCLKAKPAHQELESPPGSLHQERNRKETGKGQQSVRQGDPGKTFERFCA